MFRWQISGIKFVNVSEQNPFKTKQRLLSLSAQKLDVANETNAAILVLSCDRGLMIVNPEKLNIHALSKPSMHKLFVSISEKQYSKKTGEQRR